MPRMMQELLGKGMRATTFAGVEDGSENDSGREREIMPGYSSLGFRIPPEAGVFVRLLESAADVSTSYPAAVGGGLLCSGDYYRLWQNPGLEGALPVLECSPMPGMVAFLAEPKGGPRIKAWVVNPSDASSSEPFAVCFDAPHYLLGAPPPVGELCSLALTMLATECLVFDTPEDLAADPQTHGWPTPAFAATGLYDDEGNERAEPTTQAFLTGQVLLGVMATNDLTCSHFRALRVRTRYGEIFVCLPVEAIDEDPTGKVIAVSGWMSGSFPECLPSPQGAWEYTMASGIDGEAVEARLRELTLGFIRSEDFTPIFTEMHPDKITRCLSAGIGLIKKDLREAAWNLSRHRQPASPKLRRRYLKAARTAPIVFAHIVMANASLFERGKGAPALVVLAWGETGMKIMARARSVLSRVHYDMPENERETRLAALIEDEEYHFGRRRPLPEWLVGGHEAYAADLFISGAALDHERLRMEVVVCLAEPGPEGLTMAIPGRLIQQALHELNPGPKPPPLPPRRRRLIIPGDRPPPLPPGTRA